MNILSLGMNDIREPQDGLPEYERYFGQYFSQNDSVVMINVLNKPADNKIEIVEINPNLTQILVSVPNFFAQEETDVWKYPDLIKAFFQLGSWRPNIIIMHDWFFAPVLASLPDMGVKTIYFCHTFVTASNATLGTIHALNEMNEIKGMNDLSDLVIGNSKHTIKDIIDYMPQVQPKSIVSELGVDKEIYLPYPNIESKRILYMGRLDPVKGIDIFLDELREFPLPEGYEVIVAGSGGLLSVVVDANFDGIIKYVGQVSGQEKLDLIKSAKYMVFPSLYEPWGLSLNEGLACGKICVATNVGGHAEQISHLENGYLTNDSIIGAIMDIEGNPNLQVKIAQNASNSARDIRPHLKEMEGILHDFSGI